MANVVCPRCHERVDAPDDAAQAKCPFCAQILALLETRVTAAAPAPSQAFQADIEHTPNASGNVAFGVPERYGTWEEFRAISPAIQREMLKLATQPLPDLRRVKLESLPENVPAALDGWRKPLGSLSISGASRYSKWIGSVFVISIGLFLICAGVMLFVLQPKPKWGELGGGTAYLLIGVSCALCGCWLASTSRPMLGLSLWIFEEGLFLRRGGQLTVARFEDVEGYQVSNHTGRPIFWLKLAGEDSIVLSVGHCPEVMPLMEYIEIRMAAAQLVQRLKQIWDGKAEKFGVVKLTRQHFRGPGFEAPWSEVNRVVDDPLHLFVDWKELRDWVAIKYRDVSFPHLVMAISHVMIEEHARLGPP